MAVKYWSFQPAATDGLSTRPIGGGAFLFNRGLIEITAHPGRSARVDPRMCLIRNLVPRLIGGAFFLPRAAPRAPAKNRVTARRAFHYGRGITCPGSDMTAIDLRSDTLTQPTETMLERMRGAALGDDSRDG